MRRMSLAVVLLVCLVLPVQAEDAKNPLEAYARAGAVTPMHKKLQGMVGEWTYTGKFWMTPGAPVMEISGTAKRTLILGGRFVRDEITSSSFGEFKGIGMLGYDNTRKKYVSTWMDSMNTSIMMTTGTVDKTGKLWTFRGEMLDPATRKKIQVRDVIKVISKDKSVMMSYHKRPGAKEERKVMEITYTRKK